MSNPFGKFIADLQWEDLQKMPPSTFRELLKLAEGKARVDEIIAERKKKLEQREKAEEAVTEIVPEEQTPVVPAEIVSEPTPEEQAEAAEAQRVAAEQEAQRQAAEKAAQEKAAQEAEAAKNKRWVIDFQARDEAGNPIGAKTHLEAPTQEELIEKMKTSYEHAVRAIARLKKQKPTFRQPEPAVVITQEQLDAAAEDLKSSDASKRAAAVRTIAAQESSAERAKAVKAQQEASESKESLDFLRRHVGEYYICDANTRALSEFMQDNNLEWTADNLDIAFGNLETQLAQDPNKVKAPVQEPAPVAAVNPAPLAAAVAPTVATTVPAAPVTPVPQAVPVAAAPAASVNTPTRRPGVNGGLVPGTTSSGVRPQTKTAEQTNREIVKEYKSLTPDEIKRRHRQDPKYYDKVNAAIAALRQPAA